MSQFIIELATAATRCLR